jgi:hypothetical protein
MFVSRNFLAGEQRSELSMEMFLTRFTDGPRRRSLRAIRQAIGNVKQNTKLRQVKYYELYETFPAIVFANCPKKQEEIDVKYNRSIIVGFNNISDAMSVCYTR